MTRSRFDTRRANDVFTAGQDAVIQRLTAAGYGPADIAQAVNHTPKQVVARQYYLRHEGRSRGQVARAGWPVHNPSKQSDWGKGFWDEDYKFKGQK
jgi:hypothetical protein